MILFVWWDMGEYPNTGCSRRRGVKLGAGPLLFV
ncbi:unnamed protein product [Brassica oleracea]|uniref:(rape) hypothetical protein n=1 Tax=Brassica napus TaxID=3708 RepID=A0A816JU63_BRANA|nr:unnamed protein product [Brassica napus]